ncbi:hypothetical protein CCUS01_15846 [Colletotrichum cuscutae]|uniref:Uncharacterized protein n=1 Tax=Colletotrichum cuscutae TaxID=1209917 RepID=A0AAI9Y7M6_9PEZI|nr:hypothetical protein CCUS01_15846 [Colletotrichum cuscutae]
MFSAFARCSGVSMDTPTGGVPKSACLCFADGITESLNEMCKGKGFERSLILSSPMRHPIYRQNDNFSLFTNSFF